MGLIPYSLRSLTITTFSALGVPDDICAALAEKGIIEAFPIQEMTLPLALGGQDLIGQAKTGTGKTFGFGLPLITRVVAPGTPEWDSFKHAGKPQALVVVPTRELAVQVAGDLELATKNRGTRVLCVYGGRSYEPQVEALENGVEIIVGTPGRLIDLMKQRHLSLDAVKVLVLDEADEMLDMGFLPDVETLVSKTPATRQTLLFSATMPGQIVSLARRYMSQPTHIRANDPNDSSSTVDSIEQHVWRAHTMDKPELVARVLQANGRGLSIIFTRTKRTASNLTDDLKSRGFAVGAVHGDLGQGAREQALRAFRNGKIDVLVATDVAARGIDINDVTHVINYECPDDENTYLHRIGRTGRAGNDGVAITLVDWQDMTRWQIINKALGLAFNDPIETYSSSEHVYTGLGIDAGVTGKLPQAAQTRSGLESEEKEDLGEPKKKSNNSSGSGGKSGNRNGNANRNGQRRNGQSSGGASGDKAVRKNSTESAERKERPTREPKTRNRTRGGKSSAE